MLEFIALENIRRFHAQLDTCTDPEQRTTLLNLLQLEREHLAQAQLDVRGRASD